MSGMNYTDVMVDLETLGTRPGSVILSIGAVAFNEGQLESGWATFNSGPISVKDSRGYGLTIDEGTLAWWLEQSSEARVLLQECLRPSLPRLPETLRDLNRWFPQNAAVWSNGANFDSALLQSAFNAAEVVCPWSYYAVRCYRTMKNLFPGVIQPTFQGMRHDALADALHQTRHLQAILKHIGGVR